MHFFLAIAALSGLSIVWAEVGFPEHTLCLLQRTFEVQCCSNTERFYHDNFLDIIHSGIRVEIPYPGKKGAYVKDAFKSLFTPQADRYGRYRAVYLYWAITDFGEYEWIYMTSEIVRLWTSP